jgi:hypothetical protein
MYRYCTYQLTRVLYKIYLPYNSVIFFIYLGQKVCRIDKKYVVQGQIDNFATQAQWYSKMTNILLQ